MHIIGGIILVLFLIFCMYILLLFARHIMLFDSVPCPDCDSTMHFRGEKHTDKGDMYVFQCPKCNAVKEIPAKEFDARFYDFHNNINVY